jgi:hypothetical protein
MGDIMASVLAKLDDGPQRAGQPKTAPPAMPASPAPRTSATFVSDKAVWHVVVGKLGDWGLEMRFSGHPSEKDTVYAWDIAWDGAVREAANRQSWPPRAGP